MYWFCWVNGRGTDMYCNETSFWFTKPHVKSQNILKVEHNVLKGKIHVYTHTHTLELTWTWETKLIWRSVVDSTKVTLYVVEWHILCVSRNMKFCNTAQRSALSLALSYSYMWVKNGKWLHYHLQPTSLSTVYIFASILMKALKTLSNSNICSFKKISMLSNISVNSCGQVVFGLFLAKSFLQENWHVLALTINIYVHFN